MFQNVRVGSMLYILHRQNQKLESGEVLSVLPSPTRQSTYMGGQYLPQNNLVDIQVKVNEEVIKVQGLMGDATTADYNNMIVSEDVKAIIQELSIIRRNSEKVLESVPMHEDTIQRCTSLIKELSAEDTKEIDTIKEEVSNLRNDMSDIKSMLSDILIKKGKE